MTSLLRPHSHRTEREDTNTSILKNKKLGADAVQQKKHALTQEFKELHRERNVQVSDNRDDGPKPKEHKLRHALDNLLGENKKRDTRLNELQLRLNIMKRDDISGVEVSEKSVDQRFNKTVGSSSGKKMRGFDQEPDTQLKDGKDLVERFSFVKQTLQMIIDRREEEEETQKMLDAKITELLRNQKVFTDRIGKKEALYGMMEKRFLNLGKTEFAAKNKLTRTSNKLLTQKREIEKQKQHEEEYFNLKRTAFKRSQSAVEGFKDTISKNLIYLEEVRLRKDEVDEKLDEVNYEEKQIISKRQASEYILLYIDLLENLERNYLKKNLVPKKEKEPKLNYDTSPREKPKSLISAGTEETPKRQANTSGSGSHSNELERKGQNSSDTNKDRDIIITRIAQFYDQHPGGTNALVSTLLKMYHDMQLKEQSLSMRHQDLNTERLERQNEIEELEKSLFALQQGFILMEEKSEIDEEASPEHVRETERKVAGKLGQYDYKTVKLGEYLVNLCATGIQDTLSKLSKASCSLVTKSIKKVPVELGAKAKEIEGFLAAPKPDLSIPDLTAVRNRSISKAVSNYEESAKDTSISIRPRTISLSTSSPKEGLINLQKADQGDEKQETSYRFEEPGRMTMSQQLVGEEFNKIEYLFKSCVPSATSEILYKWNEKIFESKWMLDYLSKDDIKKILNRYTYYYGNDISTDLLKSIIKDLKNEARLLQRKRTSEAFSMTEELLSLYLNYYKQRKNDLCKRFDTEIKSEILDDLNHVLAVSEHVEKAHTARYHNLFSEQQTEETEVWKRTEERRDSESEMELVSLRAKTPEIKNIRTTREAISDLHSNYVKERRGVASSRRSYSVPKIRVVVSKTRKESFESSDNEDVGEHKGGLQLKKNASGHEEKKGTEGSASKKRNVPNVRRNSAIPTEGEGVDTVEEDRDYVKKIVVKKELARNEKKVYPIPAAFFKAQQKSRNVEEFKKKLIKDEEVLRKIALLEKRQTEFDKKSKDYEKRRDYVPNFSLLQRFDLNREKHRDQIIQEWWKRQEAGVIETIDKEKTSATFIISSSRNFEQQTDSTRNILISHKRRSFSRSGARPWMLSEEATLQTSRPGTGNGSRGKSSTKRKKDSFEDVENKLFNNAVLSQNQAILEAEVHKL